LQKESTNAVSEQRLSILVWETKTGDFDQRTDLSKSSSEHQLVFPKRLLLSKNSEATSGGTVNNQQQNIPLALALVHTPSRQPQDSRAFSLPCQ